MRTSGVLATKVARICDGFEKSCYNRCVIKGICRAGARICRVSCVTFDTSKCICRKNRAEIDANGKYSMLLASRLVDPCVVCGCRRGPKTAYRRFVDAKCILLFAQASLDGSVDGRLWSFRRGEKRIRIYGIHAYTRESSVLSMFGAVWARAGVVRGRHLYT